jgi:YidC/Oxa1 family membrane protein insertase
MNFFYTVLEQPLINILVAFYHALTWLHIPYDLGFAIILMTILIRFLLFPFTHQQLKTSKKMQEIQPHLSKIKEKHKGDMKSQQEATMALYKEHGVNPAAGCLPGIVQIVILLFGLYPALRKILEVSPKETVKVINDMLYFPSLHLTQPWNTDFFGFHLGQTPQQQWHTLGLYVLIVPILTALLQFIQSKMMMPAVQPETKAVAKAGSAEDFMATFQKQSMYLLPVMIGVFSFNFQVGLSLYWNTFSVFGIIQQYYVSGWGSLEKFFKKKEN